jgi:hypothetical protein
MGVKLGIGNWGIGVRQQILTAGFAQTWHSIGRSRFTFVPDIIADRDCDYWMNRIVIGRGRRRRSEVRSQKSEIRRQRSASRGGLGRKLLTPLVAQDFHLCFERDHARGDAFVFFGNPVDGSIDRALVDQTLKFFVNAQPQHFFPAAGRVSCSKIKQDDVEQRFELE